MWWRCYAHEWQKKPLHILDGLQERTLYVIRIYQLGLNQSAYSCWFYAIDNSQWVIVEWTMSTVGKSAIHLMIDHSNCKQWAGINSADRIKSNQLLETLTLICRTRKHTNIQSLFVNLGTEQCKTEDIVLLVNYFNRDEQEMNNSWPSSKFTIVGKSRGSASVIVKYCLSITLIFAYSFCHLSPMLSMRGNGIWFSLETFYHSQWCGSNSISNLSPPVYSEWALVRISQLWKYNYTWYKHIRTMLNTSIPYKSHCTQSEWRKV